LYDPERDVLYVVDSAAGLLEAIDGALLTQAASPRVVFSLPGIVGVSLGRAGILAIGSRLTGAALLLAPDGTLLGGLDTGVGPLALRALAFGEDGALYVLDDRQKTIVRLGGAP